MDKEKLIASYLESTYTMQVSTVSGDQPWICTVYFVADDNFNLYWASLPSRRHSKEIINNPRVASAIVVRNINGDPVIGIQIEGTAELKAPSVDYQGIAEKYALRFKRGKQWVNDFVSGKTEHRLYKLTPTSIYLFDEQNFPGGQRQKVR